MAKITDIEKKYKEDLTIRDKKILGYIEEKWYETGGYTPSYREICKDMNIKSTSTVYAVMEKLEKKGYIKKVTNAGDKVKRYELLGSSLNEEGTVLAKNRKDKRELISLKVAKIPYIEKIVNVDDIYAIENMKEYMAFPLEYAKQVNMYVFKSRNSYFSENGILKGSLVIFDTVEHYIHGDLIAYLDKQKKKIGIRQHKRTEDKTDILGKIMGVYTQIKY